MGESALVVLVPEAERLVAEHRLRHDHSAGAGVPAHITVLYPFLDPGDLDGAHTSLQEVFAAHLPLTYRLTRTARFPDVLYLTPEPGEPFRRLSQAVWERWPDHPPYGGIHEQVVPHLTVAQGVGADVIDRVEAELTSRLPISAAADEVTLLVEEGGRWSKLRSYPLGG